MNSQNYLFYQARQKILFALLFGYFFYYCARQNFGFAILGIQQSFNLTTKDTGIISAGFLLFYGLGQAINGGMGDQYGGRRLVTAGALLSVFFNLVASFAVGFWSLFLPWCAIGYSQSLGFAPSTKMITDWWREDERGKIFGLYLSASGVASIIAYVVCVPIAHHLSWPWLFRLPVALLFIAALIFYYLARDKPQDLGFASLTKYQNKIKGKDHDTHGDTQTQAPITISIKSRYSSVIKHSAFQMASCTMGFCSIARYTLIIWIPFFYLNTDKSTLQSYSMIALPIGMALGAVVAGYISDQIYKCNYHHCILIFMFSSCILSFLLYFLSIIHVYSFYNFILLLMLGFFVFGAQTPLFALCPRLLNASSSATGIGIMNAYGYGFSAGGEVLVGYLIKATNQLSIIFIVVALSSLMSIFCTLFSQRLMKAQNVNNDVYAYS